MKLHIIGLIVVAAFASGCAGLKQQVGQWVDLGDGLVMDVVPVGMVPGDAGKVIRTASDHFRAEREARLGPFNGLPYTTRRTVVLKDGTEIPEERISKIIRTRTPIMPEPVVDVIEPDEFPMRPVIPAPEATATPPQPPNDAATGQKDLAPVQDLSGLSAEDRELLEKAP